MFPNFGIPKNNLICHFPILTCRYVQGYSISTSHAFPNGRVTSPECAFKAHIEIQLNFSGSNTDGLFTTAVSSSFSSPWEENLIAADLG